jgi:hypothetical protein
MKSYHEMVQWVVDNNTQLRYYEWPALMAISESYGIDYSIVQADVQFEKNLREKAAKEKRKAESRASNEQRRLANFARKQGVEQ